MMVVGLLPVTPSRPRGVGLPVVGADRSRRDTGDSGPGVSAVRWEQARPQKHRRPRGGGDGSHDGATYGWTRGRRLGDGESVYKERQLKVVAPPNSEPVKNRREGRDRGRDRKTP